MSTPADDLRAALNLPPETKFPDVIAAIYALRSRAERNVGTMSLRYELQLGPKLAVLVEKVSALASAADALVSAALEVKEPSEQLTKALEGMAGVVDDAEVTPKVSPPKSTERVEMRVPLEPEIAGGTARGYPDGDSSGND